MSSNTSAAPAAAVDPEAVDPTRTPAALWQMLRSLEQRVSSAEAEGCKAQLEVLATEAAGSAEAKARAEKRAAAAVEMAAVAAKANALAAAALCQQRRQDWAAAAKAKAERLAASAEPRAEEAAPRRPLAPFAHHNHATSRPLASPAVTHRDHLPTAGCAAAPPTDHDGGGGATGCDGRCGGPCTDGSGCGVRLQAPRPPATAALPTAGIDGCGGASNLEPQTGAHAKLRDVAQGLAPTSSSPDASRRLEFEPGASGVRRRARPSPRPAAAAALLLFGLLCYGGCALPVPPTPTPTPTPSPSPSPTLPPTPTTTPTPLRRSWQLGSEVRRSDAG